jgi:hypothetical protein
MKKFIITEEEKNRILGMHQDHGYNSLNEQYGVDAKKNAEVLKAQATQAQNNNTSVLDQIKKIHSDAIESKMAGEPAALVRYPNSDVYYFIQKGGASGINQQRYFQYFKDKDGNVTRTNAKIGNWKIEGNEIKTTPPIKKSDNTTQPPKTVKQTLKAAGQSTPNTKESSIGINYQYNYDGDTKYVYGVKDGKWFGKNLANGKEFDLSSIKTTVANLNNKFPNALTQPETPVDMTPTGTTLTATTDVVPKKLTDMSKLELDIMNQKQPLAFKSAYSKLGAFDRKKVDDNMAGK